MLDDPRPAEGPWVAMAVLCERIAPKPDGTVDVLGIVDGVVVEPEHAPDDPLELRPKARVTHTAVVSLRAGDLRGRHAMGLQSAYPSGPAGPGMERAIEFTDENPAASLVVPLQIDVHETGVYAFDVLFDGRRLTRMSLWVAYQR
jgi:hypothetical protein